jgi:hypothetical protein
MSDATRQQKTILCEPKCKLRSNGILRSYAWLDDVMLSLSMLDRRKMRNMLA